MCTHMTTKNISIMEDVYYLLLRNKFRNESFSDVLRRTLSKKINIMEFAGAWKDISNEDIDKMKSNIEANDKKQTKELLKKHKK